MRALAVLAFIVALAGAAVLVFQPFPSCLVGLGPICFAANPLTFGMNPNFVAGGAMVVLGFAGMAAFGVRRRGSVFLSTGIFGILGLVILILALVSFILGFALGGFLFTGFGVNLPTGSLVLQPWMTTILFAAIGLAFIIAGSGRKRRGRR